MPGKKGIYICFIRSAHQADPVPYIFEEGERSSEDWQPFHQVSPATSSRDRKPLLINPGYGKSIKAWLRPGRDGSDHKAYQGVPITMVMIGTLSVRRHRNLKRKPTCIRGWRNRMGARKRDSGDGSIIRGAGGMLCSKSVPKKSKIARLYQQRGRGLANWISGIIDLVGDKISKSSVSGNEHRLYDAAIQSRSLIIEADAHQINPNRWARVRRPYHQLANPILIKTRRERPAFG
jgi:hypothetical protein